ncbi:RNA polymerase sigma factor [Salinibacterium sp. ZJ454]|uniref:RNA polymerase sigma factor n=1 Tax=Salinibacterium sp. ZJ454 TaxID=2708339 RepID=UPI001421BEFE|nr:RNA polymerase sigma factor [Salinibacterium sp. ZJ454]
MTRASRPEPADRLSEVLTAVAPDLLKYLQRRVNGADAADLLAETMTTAWRREHLLPGEPEQARMWLYGIARNTLLNAERSERRRLRLADRLRSMLAVHHDAVGQPADTGGEVRDAIERLEPHLAELIRLVHWDGLTLVDAAALIGIPASTARGRYQRAKQELREALGSESIGTDGGTFDARHNAGAIS